MAVGPERRIDPQGLAALKPADETLPLYHAALARSRADWLTGMNLSRLFTVLGQQAGCDGVLSVGRVQTPTLRLVVDRDREIARFVAVPYWSIEVTPEAGQHFIAQWSLAVDKRLRQRSVAHHASTLSSCTSMLKHCGSKQPVRRATFAER